MPEISIRAMTAGDLAGVDALQRRAYGPALHEASEVLAARLRLYPPGCWVAVADRDVVAYLFSHPWSGPTPPLRAVLARLPAVPDHYYLHDLAIDPDRRGRKLGRRLCALGRAQAQALGLPCLRLVAVQSSVGFWRRQGFAPAVADAAAAQAVRESYGEDACLMLGGSGTA